MAREDLSPHPRRSYAFKVALAFIVTGAIVLVVHWNWERSKIKSVQGVSAPVGQLGGSTPAVSNEEMRIAAGYTGTQYIDRAGKVWGPDHYFKGGQGDAWPRRLLFRTVDPSLYQTSRSGTFSYDIPSRPGIYELHLYFAEEHFGPANMAEEAEGKRIFDVVLNGQMLLESFDPVRDAGGPDTAT